MMISRAKLRTMTPDAVAKALDDGQLAHLIDPRSVTVTDLNTWDADDVAAARAEGRLRHLGVDPEENPDRERITRLSPDELAAAVDRGELDAFLSGDTR